MGEHGPDGWRGSGALEPRDGTTRVDALVAAILLIGLGIVAVASVVAALAGL